MRSWYRRFSRFYVSWFPRSDAASPDQKRKPRRATLETLDPRKMLADGNALPAGDVVFISGKQWLDINPQTGNRTVLDANASGVSDVVVAGDGSVYVAGSASFGQGEGVFKLNIAQGQFTQLSSTPADRLALDGQGDLFGLQKQGGPQGGPAGYEIDLTSGVQSPILSGTSGTARDIAVGSDGTVYLSGTPNGLTEGIYKVNTSTGQLTLVSQVEADNLEIDAHGNFFGAKSSLGQYGDSGDFYEVAAGASAATHLAAAPVLVQDLSLAPDGGLAFSGSYNGNDEVIGEVAPSGSVRYVEFIPGGAAASALAIVPGTPSATEQGPVAAALLGPTLLGSGTPSVFQLGASAQTPVGALEVDSRSDIAVAPNGKIILAGQPAGATQAGIYQQGAQPGQFTLISAKQADRIAVDNNGDIFGMEFGTNQYGAGADQSSGAIFEIAAGGGAPVTLFNQAATPGVQFSDIAVGADGNLLVAAQPTPTSTDGIYKLLNGQLQLVSSQPADEIEVDAAGNVLDLRVDRTIGTTELLDINLQTSSAATIYAAPSGAVFNDLTIDPQGNVLLAGAPRSGAYDGVYRLGPAGELDLVSFSLADRIAAQPGTVSVAPPNLGETLAAARNGELFELGPASGGETVLENNAGAQVSDVEIGPDGRVIFSGQPDANSQPGIYRQGTQPGSFTLVSTQKADRLAVDDQGDIFGMEFGHGQYGQTDQSTAMVFEINGQTNVLTTLINDPPQAGVQFNDIAVTPAGRLFLAATPPAPDNTAGIYGVDTTSGALSLLAAGPAQRIAASPTGSLVGMSNDGTTLSIFRVDETSGTQTPIYAESPVNSQFGDLAIGSDGNPLVSGDSQNLQGIFKLSASSPTPQLVSFFSLAESFAVLSTELNGSGATVTATEGTAAKVTLATFTDLKGAGPLSDYSGSINWGDGSSADVASISGPDANGAFTVSGSHTYAEESAAGEVVAVTIERAGAPIGTIFSTAQVADASLTANAVAVAATEGTGFSGPVATFTDADPAAAAGDYTVTIDWGDQTSATPGSVTLSGGVFTVDGTHTYAEEASTLPMVVTIADHGAGASVNGTAHVADAALTAAAVAVAATEGAGFSGRVATFTDANPAAAASDYTVTINWGDQTSATSGSVTLSGGVFTVNGAHTYAEEASNLPVTVTIADHGVGASVSGTAKVTDASLSATAAPAIAVTEGAGFSGPVATFTDADPAAAASDYTALINWGDQTTSTPGSVTLSGGVFTVNGTHTYAEEASNLPVTVTIADHGAGATANGTAHVADAALTATAAAVAATQGIGFSGKVATFIDANPAASAGDYTVTINWGDQTSATPGSVALTGGVFTVNGTHTYAEEASNLPVTVTIADHGAGATVNGTAQAADAPLSAAALPLHGQPGNTLSNVAVATFSDADPAGTVGDYTATIDWGDGTTSTGTVAAQGAGFVVTGSHSFAALGNPLVKVAIADTGGASASVAASALIGTANQVAVDSVYENLLGRAADPGGLALFVSELTANTPLATVVSQIDHSDEFYRDLVTDDFRKFLDRAPDAAGLAAWVSALNAGLTIEEFEASIISSPEFFANAGSTDALWLGAVYEALLGRPGDASGLQFWSGQLTAGVTRFGVALAIATSPEQLTAQVSDFYFRYLDRAADPAGLTGWLEQLQHGESEQDVIASIVGSTEYYKNHTS